MSRQQLTKSIRYFVMGTLPGIVIFLQSGLIGHLSVAVLGGFVLFALSFPSVSTQRVLCGSFAAVAGKTLTPIVGNRIYEALVPDDGNQNSSGSQHDEDAVVCDGVSQISLVDGVIRMDLARVYYDQNDEQVIEVIDQLVMPPNGFLKGFGKMEKLVQQLKDANLVSTEDGKLTINPEAPMNSSSPGRS